MIPSSSLSFSLSKNNDISSHLFDIKVLCRFSTVSLLEFRYRVASLCKISRKHILNSNSCFISHQFLILCLFSPLKMTTTMSVVSCRHYIASIYYYIFQDISSFSYININLTDITTKKCFRK